jgi:hypothetical protein
MKARYADTRISEGWTDCPADRVWPQCPSLFFFNFVLTCIVGIVWLLQWRATFWTLEESEFDLRKEQRYISSPQRSA